MPYKVFISHAGTDTWVAKQIKFHIENCGASTFLDESDIEIGDKFENKIKSELKSSQELFVLFTPWSLERPYVWLEIGAAFILELPIIAAFYGVSLEEVLRIAKIPNVIKETNSVPLNQLHVYLSQLKKRVNLQLS